jgi:uncharacterized protein
MHNITPLECSRIAQDLQIRKVQVESVVQLLDDGNTVPFITRYRKERTGGLNEEVIREIQGRVQFLRQLHDRKHTILKSIEAQGRLTDELREAIERADTTKRLEDLYLPYKPKKRSLAGAAREKGLEPLALAFWHSDAAAAGTLDELFASLANPERQLNSAEDVRQGVQHILAEMIAETADVRAAVRRMLWETGRIASAKNEKLGETQGLDYKDYFQFTEPARQIPPHRILALNRGEKEGAIRVRMEWATEPVHTAAVHALAEHLRAVAGKMPLPAPAAEPPPPVAAAVPSPDQPAAAASEIGAPAPPAEATPTPPQEPVPPPAESPPSAAPTLEAPPEAPLPEAPPPEAPPPEAPPLIASLIPPTTAPATAGSEALAADSEFRSPHTGFLKVALEDALARLLMPSLEREVRHELTDEAETHAVTVFARNLRSLLLQPPLRGRRVLAIDPGFRTGCKLAALDEYGNMLEHGVIYPFGGAPRERKGPRDKKTTHTPADTPPAASAAAPAEVPAAPIMPSADHASPEQASPEQASPEQASPEQASPEQASPEQASANQAAATAPAHQESAPTTATAAPGPAPTEPATVTAEASAPAPEAAPSDAPPAQAAEPPPPAPDRRGEAKAKIQDFVTRHGLTVLALGNGTGCRETEELIAELIASTLPDLSYVVVNEAGASVYSVSQVGREEFPSHDATTRGAISIGRRLQDPLSELVKIDPQSIGVGLYQHDMGRRELRDSLEAVVESSVNLVGVDVNTASVPLLRYVSGLNQLVARELVEYRKQHGPFASREQLTQVPNLGTARYTQAAGFLKLPEAANPLDHTWIHPESYALAEAIVRDAGYELDVIRDPARQQEFHARLADTNPAELAQRLGAGVPTVADIMQALLKPGRDPREDLPPPIFKKGVLKLEDLQPGMELKGTVLNVVDFGAFVDIGLKDSGLVHISQMANRYIKSPYDIVSVNDVVTVWVINVDQERHRVSLSLIKPGTDRRPPERRPQGQRAPQQHGQRPPQQQGPRSPQGEGQRPPQGEGQRPPQPGRGPRRGPHPHGAPQGQPGGPPRGPRPPRGPQPRRDGAPAVGNAAPPEGARPAPPQAAPPPPPRKPRREPPKPKLTKEAIEGKVPLRTFGELSALFAAKREEDRPKPAEAPAAAAPPPAEPPPPEPPTAASAQPPAEPTPPPAEPTPPPLSEDHSAGSAH